MRGFPLIAVGRMVGLAFSILVCSAACAPATGETVRSDSTVRCEEDEPCWDCTTMGNRICGTPKLEVSE